MRKLFLILLVVYGCNSPEEITPDIEPEVLEEPQVEPGAWLTLDDNTLEKLDLYYTGAQVDSIVYDNGSLDYNYEAIMMNDSLFFTVLYNRNTDSTRYTAYFEISWLDSTYSHRKEDSTIVSGYWFFDSAKGNVILKE